MKQVKRPMPQRPADNAPLEEKTLWLIETHAFYAAENKVVELYCTDDTQCRLSADAFLRLFRSWYKQVGKKNDYAATRWDMAAERLNIRGVRMRPDKPYPQFEEKGAWFKNLYCQPVHTGDGDLVPFFGFMERFLPVKVQREWFYGEMAHKQAKPWIPGTAVMFVADNDEGVREGEFGTGRGMLFNIAHKLYGEEYAKSQDFDMIDGTSDQAVFTDWIHNRILCTIDEAQTSATGYRRGERNASYEALKNKVDPAPKRMEFKVKNGKAFNDYSYCTFWVATNHSNAIAIPRWDRRFTILRNGRKMTPEEAREIAAWMEIPGNIAALSRWLAERDLSNFNMFEPLDTDAKAEMAELARTPVEDALVDLMDDGDRGLVFTRPHLEEALEDLLCGNRGGYVGKDGNFVSDRDRKHMPGPWRGQLEGFWNSYVMLLKTTAGSPCRIRVQGRQMKLYCFRIRKKAAEKLEEPRRRWHAKKWGRIDPLKDELKVVPSFAQKLKDAIGTPPSEPKQ